MLLLIGCLYSQATKPAWVEYYEKGEIGKIDDSNSKYYGVGISKVSQAEADDLARTNFAKMVNSVVKSQFERKIEEAGNNYSDKTNVSNEILTDISLKGISITNTYFNPTLSTYYSLIIIDKDEYVKNMNEEVNREIISREEKLKIAKKEREIAEEESNEARIRKSIRIKEYGEFLNIKLPQHIVTTETADLKPGFELSVNSGISPLSVENAKIGFCAGVFEISAQSYFSESKFAKQEFSARLELLKNEGEFYKTSVTIGLSNYQKDYLYTDIGKVKGYTTPFVTATMFLPELFQSIVTANFDLRRYSIGFNNYSLFTNFKDKLALVFELNYLPDVFYRNKYGDKLIANVGIRFKANENFESGLFYENNQMLALVLNFKF